MYWFSILLNNAHDVNHNQTQKILKLTIYLFLVFIGTSISFYIISFDILTNLANALDPAISANVLISHDQTEVKF